MQKTEGSTNINNNGYEELFMTWENMYDIILNKKAEIKTTCTNWFQFCKNNVCQGAYAPEIEQSLLGGWVMDDVFILYLCFLLVCFLKPFSL